MDKNNNKIKIAVGLSGGVDSSVASLLLKEQGYDITGVYVQCWDAKADGCTAEEDRASAVSVASFLDIKFKHLNFVKEYKQKVISYFYDEYKKGRTPNPDIMCNIEIKFGLFLNWAIENGYDYVATGHYAQVRCCNAALGEDLLLCSQELAAVKDSPTQQHRQCLPEAHYHLLQGKDESKDQSYFLYRLNQDRLSKVIFPLGGLKKTEVRSIAQKAKLPTYNRPDSQGICFIGKVDIKEFLKKEIKEQKGELLFVEDNSVIGDHDGVWFYTIGQRHGFRVNKYFGLPLYVVGKNVDQNQLIVGFSKHVLQNTFEVQDLHWINDPPTQDFECLVRIRNLGKLHRAKVRIDSKDKLLVEMDTESFGIAPGQSAVLYKDSVVLGGGIIS